MISKLTVMLHFMSQTTNMKSITMDLHKREVSFRSPNVPKTAILSTLSSESISQNTTSPDIVKNLDDYLDVQIFTKIYMGPNTTTGEMQEFEMIPDTGSNWLWVNSRLCENCPLS